MGFTYNQQHLYYNKSGLIYYFYTMDNSVFVKVIKDDQVYSLVKISDNVIDYSVDMDDSGTFHLVSILTTGDLKYCIHRDNRWDCRNLTKYDARYSRFKNLKIFVVNNNIHILMAVSNMINSELWTLKHHYWNKHVWMNKKVCDIVTEKYDIPFHCDIDSNNNIHIVYKSLSQMKYELFYCKYSVQHNSWSFPQRLSNDQESNSQPFIFCDKENCIHVVWSGFYNNNLGIYYSYNKKMNISQNQWSPITRLSNEGANCTNPFIVQMDNDIKIIWKQNHHFHEGILDLSDHSIGQMGRIFGGGTKKLSSISILGSRYKTFTKVKVPITYGDVGQKIYLVGLDRVLPEEETVDNKPIIESAKYMFRSENKVHSIDETSQILPIASTANEDRNLDNGETLNHVENHRKESVDTKLDMEEWIPVMDAIHKNQRDMNQLLNQLKIDQEINGNRIEELLDLFENLNEELNSSNKTFFKRLKNLFH